MNSIVKQFTITPDNRGALVRITTEHPTSGRTEADSLARAREIETRTLDAEMLPGQTCERLDGAEFLTNFVEGWCRVTSRYRITDAPMQFISPESAADATVETPMVNITTTTGSVSQGGIVYPPAEITASPSPVRNRQVIEDEAYDCDECKRGCVRSSGFKTYCPRHDAELNALDPDTGMPPTEPFPGYEKAKAESDALWDARTRWIYRQWAENQYRWAESSAFALDPKKTYPPRPSPERDPEIDAIAEAAASGDPVRLAVRAEIANVAASRLAEARLALWQTARRALAKRATWLRCKDHDQPLAVYEVEDYVIRMRCPEKGCTEARCLTMDTPAKLRGFCVRVFDIGAEHGGTKPE